MGPQCFRAGGAPPPRGSLLSASVTRRFAGSAQAQQPQQHGWLGGAGPAQPLLRPQRQLGGAGAARRRRLSSQQLARRPQQQQQRAADMVRGLAADDDEGASVAEAASSWWRSLGSPYDREILLLAVPALFSVLLDPIMGMVGGRGWGDA